MTGGHSDILVARGGCGRDLGCTAWVPKAERSRLVCTEPGQDLRSLDTPFRRQHGHAAIRRAAGE